MRVLFLLFHGFSDVSGITKKIIGQVKGMRDNEVSVDLAYYDINSEGIRSWVIGGKSVVSLGRGIIGKIRKRVDFRELSEYIISQQYDLIYIRSFHNANPFTISFVKKLKKNNVKIILEIPTFPYDQEYQGWSEKIQLYVDKIFRKKLVRYVDAIVTFSEDEFIFGKKTIQISNGIDFETVPLHSKVSIEKEEIHLIVVAEIHFWHGIDRMIEALAAYYSKNPKLKILLHIVGDYFSEREREEIEFPIRQYGLDDYVIRHGSLFGDELDAVFNVCDFAIGSLGRHRSGISTMKSLKNREYAARGIPFAYAESDPDFDNSPYVVQFTPDEKVIDLLDIVTYLKINDIDPEVIRNSITHLSWTDQMRTVLLAARTIGQ